MGTVSDKLEYLLDTKDVIKDAIEEKQVEVPLGTPFREYAEKILDISVGGGGGAYDIESIELPDGTQQLVITDAQGGTPSFPGIVGYKYVQNTMSFTYTGTAGNTLLMCLLARGELQQHPTGWRRIGTLSESGDKNVGSVSYVQYVHIYTATCTGTMQIDYVRDIDNNRTECCVMELKDAGDIQLLEDTRQEDKSSSTTALSCTKPDGSLVIWVGTAVYWTTVTTWSCSNNYLQQIPNNGTTVPRIGLIVDDRSAYFPTITCGCNMSSRYMSLIGVTIKVKRSGL